MAPKKKMVVVQWVRESNAVKRPRPRKRIFYAVFGPLLTVAGFLIVKALKIFAGPLNKRSQQQFAEDIRTQVPFLFREGSARIIPNEGLSRKMESSYVTVAAGHLRFRFWRHMGDFSVDVGSDFAPKRYEPLPLVIAATTGPSDQHDYREDCCDLRKIDAVLRKWFEPLTDSLSTERAETTLDNAVRINNDLVDRQVAELQAKGFTPKILEL